MVTGDDIKSDGEHLQDAARRLQALKRANRFGRYALVAGIAAAGFLFFGVLGETQDWVWEYAVGVFGGCLFAGMAAQRLTLMVAFRAEGLGSVGLFDEAAPAASTDAAFPASVEVPKLPGLPQVSELDVLQAKLDNGHHSVFTAGAGRVELKADRLPIGLMIWTLNGLAFLPDAKPETADMLKDAQGVAWEFAKDAFKVLGVLSALGIGERNAAPDALPDWIAAARAHPEHFAIPWGELVAASYAGGVVRLTREREDGTRAIYQWVNTDPGWPTLLMEARFHHEYMALGRKLVIQPKADALAPALYDQFRSIYGERIDEHSAEILAELERRTMAELKRDEHQEMGPILKPAFAPVIAAYAKLPRVVQRNAWLFEQSLPPPT